MEIMKTSESPLATDIAIIGMAGRFPGAREVEELWEKLRRGEELIRFYSEGELRAEGVEEEAIRSERYVRAGGKLEGIKRFDAEFFGYSAREAELMDPQQRIFLEVAWEALEHAGVDPERYGGAIGVYAGSSMSSYLLNIYSNLVTLDSSDDFQITLGTDKDYLPTRVSYKLNLKGPSVSVQTACSTSLVAVHYGCQGLLSGDCDMAMAGGVSVSTGRPGYYYEEGGIMSPDGH
jgi:acyl transferase domain-containing protein